MENEDNIPYESQHTNKMKDMSPEEVRQKAKEAVAKNVAAVSGSVEGYVQYSDPKVAGKAARVAAETVRETSSAVKDEVRQGLPGEPVFRRKHEASELDLETESATGTLRERMGEKIGKTTSAAKERTKESAQHLKEASKEKMHEAREYMKGHSADEIREEMRDRVGRAVSGAEGGLEGFSEQADPALPKQAVHKVGETVREAGGAIRSEAHRARTSPDSAGSGGVRSEAKKMREGDTTDSGGI